MHDAQARQVQPKRQGKEPTENGFAQLRLVRRFFEKRGVLALILLVVRTQEFARVLRIRRMPRDGVEFVVAHDGQCRSRLDHRAHDAHGFQLARAPINEVADKDRLTIGMPPDEGVLAVAHLAQQCGQRVGVAVDVTDDVVAHVAP